jgi:hypothetical protein
MKNIFLSIALLSAVAFQAQAQISKGTLQAGGSLNYQTGNSEFSFGGIDIPLAGFGDVSTFGITPRVGYFIQDNLALGGRLAFARASQDGTISATATGFAFAPYARYYWGLSEKFYVFGEALVNFGSINLKVGDNDAGKFGLFQIGVNPGATYFLHEKISVEFLVNMITYSSFKPENTDAQTSLNIGPVFEAIPTFAVLFYF